MRLVRSLTFACCVSSSVGTNALAEKPFPISEADTLIIENGSPIPNYCVVQGAEAALFVMTYGGPRKVSETLEGWREGERRFSVEALFVFDADGDGLDEAWGIGRQRSDMGGVIPSNAIGSFENGAYGDAREGPYAEAFAAGESLEINDQNDGLPSLIIRLDQWMCSVLAYPNGGLGRRSIITLALPD